MTGEADPQHLQIPLLLAAVESSENAHSTDTYEMVEIIEELQNEPSTDPEDLSRVEWAYLPLLDKQSNGASPKLLERQLANQPGLFCEVIRFVFRSKNG